MIRWRLACCPFPSLQNGIGDVDVRIFFQHVQILQLLRRYLLIFKGIFNRMVPSKLEQTLFQGLSFAKMSLIYVSARAKSISVPCLNIVP